MKKFNLKEWIVKNKYRNQYTPSDIEVINILTESLLETTSNNKKITEQDNESWWSKAKNKIKDKFSQGSIKEIKALIDMFKEAGVDFKSALKDTIELSKKFKKLSQQELQIIFHKIKTSSILKEDLGNIEDLGLAYDEVHFLSALIQNGFEAGKNTSITWEGRNTADPLQWEQYQLPVINSEDDMSSMRNTGLSKGTKYTFIPGSNPNAPFKDAFFTTVESINNPSSEFKEAEEETQKYGSKYPILKQFKTTFLALLLTASILTGTLANSFNSFAKDNSDIAKTELPALTQDATDNEDIDFPAPEEGPPEGGPTPDDVDKPDLSADEAGIILNKNKGNEPLNSAIDGTGNESQLEIVYSYDKTGTATESTNQKVQEGVDEIKAWYEEAFGDNDKIMVSDSAKIHLKYFSQVSHNPDKADGTNQSNIGNNGEDLNKVRTDFGLKLAEKIKDACVKIGIPADLFNIQKIDLDYKNQNQHEANTSPNQGHGVVIDVNLEKSDTDKGIILTPWGHDPVAAYDTSPTTGATVLPPVSHDDSIFSSLIREAKWAVILATIDQEINLFPYLNKGGENDILGGYTQQDFKNIKDNENLPEKIRRAAHLCIVSRQKPELFTRPAGKILGIEFSPRAKAKHTVRRDMKGRGQQAVGPGEVTEQHLFHNLLTESLFSDLIDPQKLKNNAGQVLAFIGSIYSAAPSNQGLGIVNPENLDDATRKEIEGLGFTYNTSGEDRGTYVYMDDEPDAPSDVDPNIQVAKDKGAIPSSDMDPGEEPEKMDPKTRKYKGDLGQVNAFMKKPDIHNRMKKIDLRPELEGLLLGIIDYIHPRLKEAPARIRTIFRSLFDTIDEWPEMWYKDTGMGKSTFDYDKKTGDITPKMHSENKKSLKELIYEEEYTSSWTGTGADVSFAGSTSDTSIDTTDVGGTSGIDKDDVGKVSKMDFDELPDHTKETFQSIDEIPALKDKLSRLIDMPHELEALIRDVIIGNTQLGKEWIFHNDEDAKQKIFLSLKKVESMVTKIYKI